MFPTERAKDLISCVIYSSCATVSTELFTWTGSGGDPSSVAGVGSNMSRRKQTNPFKVDCRYSGMMARGACSPARAVARRERVLNWDCAADAKCRGLSSQMTGGDVTQTAELLKAPHHMLCFMLHAQEWVVQLAVTRLVRAEVWAITILWPDLS